MNAITLENLWFLLWQLPVVLLSPHQFQRSPLPQHPFRNTPSYSYNNSITHAVPLYLAFSNTDPYTHSNNRANHFSASFCRSIFGYSSPR